MKFLRVLLIILILSAAILIYVYFYNKPFKQTINEAHISLIAPKFERKYLTESLILDNSKDVIKNVIFCKASKGDIEYIASYSNYLHRPNLKNAIDSIVKTFKGKDLKYTITENTIPKKDSLLILGTYVEQGKICSIKTLLVKDGFNLWQILAVSPDTKSNQKKVNKFFDSIKILK